MIYGALNTTCFMPVSAALSLRSFTTRWREFNVTFFLLQHIAVPLVNTYIKRFNQPSILCWRLISAISIKRRGICQRHCCITDTLQCCRISDLANRNSGSPVFEIAAMQLVEAFEFRVPIGRNWASALGRGVA